MFVEHILQTQPFPELSVCPTNNYKVDVLQKNGVRTKQDIQFNAQWISNNSDIRKDDYVYMHTYIYLKLAFNAI